MDFFLLFAATAIVSYTLNVFTTPSESKDDENL